MNEKIIRTPISESDLMDLKIGEQVYISGVIYTARDAAHKRLCALINEGKDLPIDLNGQIIYYAGPSPTKPGNVVGAIGPTTSYRMDAYAPLLMEKVGLKGMIGKGKRSQAVIDSMVKNKVVYFGATGGAAALLSKSVKECDVILYPDLGPEAVRRLVVEKFPVTVINDIYGNDLYDEGVKLYCKD